jgi:hypothetical protein
MSDLIAGLTIGVTVEARPAGGQTAAQVTESLTNFAVSQAYA